MTEQEWNQSVDIEAMLKFVLEHTTERKLRLFACACCRQIWHLLGNKRSRFAVETTEKYADNLATYKELGKAQDAAWYIFFLETRPLAWATYVAARTSEPVNQSMLVDVVRYTAWSDHNQFNYSNQRNLLRHIVNPWLPLAPSFPPSIIDLAEAQYEGHQVAFALHDSLLDIGEDTLAQHFQVGYHPKGCWVLDLIRGRS